MNSEVVKLLRRGARSFERKSEIAALDIWRAILKLSSEDVEARKKIENYFILDGKGKVAFLARRGDGLTMRLMALIIAKALSEKFDCQFRFKWGRGFIGDKYHSMEKAVDVFDKEFVDIYSVDETTCFGFDDVFSCVGKSIFDKPVSWGFRGWDISRCAQAGLPSVIEFDENDAKRLTKCFYELPFKPELKNVILNAKRVGIDDGFVGIHIRGGDIIYGDYRLSGRYANGRCLPINIVKRIIEEQVGLSKNVILFGQDGELLNSLKNEFDVVLARDFYNNKMHGWDVLFDVVLMSRCFSVFAAGSSGVTKLAGAVGSVSVLTPEQYWGREKYINYFLCNDLDADIAGFDPFQKSFSLYHAYLLSRDFDLLSALGFLIKAMACDSDNMLYKLLMFELYLFTNEFEFAEKIASDYVSYYAAGDNEHYTTKEFFWQCEAFISLNRVVSVKPEENKYENSKVLLNKINNI
ncbi:hypothetical protein [Amphritea japonica]|uniref:Uncharacterized protein n=1 Tax=Amphritea japonica ATCC BAA-1530 TaxID=1278309 RepID=A0A7R6P7Y1_9GAMM|nr:hypothetical protein [Amphritea japonica]BBB25102.1 hypothetical protein AMJAP_0503 [Amphritea japonica ATCC BAA-1530]